MYQSAGLTKHRIFFNAQNVSANAKPKTSYGKEKVFPEIQYKDLLNFRFSQSQQKFFALQNQQYKHKICNKLTPNATIKLKLLRAKKRTVSKCTLGIGYQTAQQPQKTNFKLSQFFFPRRSLTIFKKIAFKNSNSKQSTAKTNYKLSNQFHKQDSKNENIVYTQQSVLETRQSSRQNHAKAKSLGNTFAVKAKSCTGTNILKVRQGKNCVQKKLSLQNIYQRQLQIKDVEILAPWDFQEENNRQALQICRF